MQKMTFVFATNNKGKLQEIREKLPQYQILSLQDIGFLDDIEETGTTFEENARIKAQYIFNTFGYSCFADDSGLEVKALNGAPGVYSARYATPNHDSEANMQKLLKALDGISDRQATFVTVICLILDGKEYFFRGEVQGKIIYEKRGTSGFGYDPLFIPDGYDKTFAEMSLEEKNAISHRALALEKMVEHLQSYS